MQLNMMSLPNWSTTKFRSNRDDLFSVSTTFSRLSVRPSNFSRPIRSVLLFCTPYMIENSFGRDRSFSCCNCSITWFDG
ncbi:Uncharacterised protein [Burkholderia pseudomallei]|nr:hypothetical protein Y048_6463 [Burkholderia pseudomallei MSHR456]CAJ3120741.1 Uncharacterised protein [Burkholderia pseudomallei]VBK99778.1 Uncharacterised protein [Burkholderia pseudomallei]VBN03015.1 Uncharacterised protein [Burkholderia pseudomallei]VBN71520.1 Uncharacterised protein [Burkholderia pseudomallei]